MKIIKQYIAKRKCQYFFSIGFAVIGVVAGLASYIILAKIISNLISNMKDISFYITNIIYILSFFIINECCDGISKTISHTATFQALKEMRQEISNKLFKMPLGDILEKSSGKMKDIIIDQVDHMETTLAHIIPEVTANLLGPMLLLIYMFTIDWRLTLLSIIPLIIGIAMMKSVMNKTYKENYKKSVEIGQNLNNTIVEYVNGVQVIKAFNQSETSYKKYSDSVYTNANFFYNWMRSTMTKVSIGRIVSPMGLITILPFGLYFYMEGSLNLGNFITIIVLSFATVNGILKVMNYMDDISRIGTIAGEITNILESKELRHNNQEVELKNYDMSFENVDFSYEEGIKVLDNINLRIKEKQVTAFVGPSGGGKSTIMKLLAGFWDVENGDIKIGGVPMKNISLEQLSKTISYVSQDNFLFDMSIKENIKISKPEATDQYIEEIAIKSGCHEFIKSLPDGYDTMVGTSGGKLSGGERQRISIARAMVKNAPIIILDEATSYIDPENESIVQDAIAELVKGKTLIMIAHRLRTIANVDKIFVIENGKINSEGNHEDLLETSNLYRDMWKASEKGEE